MRAILLPGMDGCAELRREFADALAPEFATSIIALPPDAEMGYADLAAFVAPFLPRDEPWLLIGESFAGPLAILLAAQRPPGLAGLVLCATFAKAPFPARALVGRLVKLLPVPAFPMPLVMPMMMGRWSTQAWSARLREALNAVAKPVLRRRLAEVAGIDVRGEMAKIECPIVRLDGRSDRLLWFDRKDDVAVARAGMRRIVIDGPHMLLQAAPRECATAIKREFPA